MVTVKMCGMITRALTVIALAGTVTMAAPAIADADTPAASPVTAGTPNSLLGNVAGKAGSVVTNLVQPNNGNVLKNLGQGLSSLTSDCQTILGPLTGSRNGVLTSALLEDGTLFGDLTGSKTGVLKDLTYSAFVGECNKR